MRKRQAASQPSGKKEAKFQTPKLLSGVNYDDEWFEFLGGKGSPEAEAYYLKKLRQQEKFEKDIKSGKLSYPSPGRKPSTTNVRPPSKDPNQIGGYGESPYAAGYGSKTYGKYKKGGQVKKATSRPSSKKKK